MKDRKSHKLKFNPYLEKLYQSDKPLIIYKVDNGYDIYTDFSKKINLTKKNIHKFLNSFERMKYKKDALNTNKDIEFADVETSIDYTKFRKEKFGDALNAESQQLFLKTISCLLICCSAKHM